MEKEFKNSFVADFTYGGASLPRDYIKSIKNGYNKPQGIANQFKMDSVSSSNYLELVLYGAKGNRTVANQPSTLELINYLNNPAAGALSLTYYIPLSDVKPQMYSTKISYNLTFVNFLLPEVDKESSSSLEYKLYFSYTTGSITTQPGSI